MAANKHGRLYTHTFAQCSPASVGLTQARPNECSYRVMGVFKMAASDLCTDLNSNLTRYVDVIHRLIVTLVTTKDAKFQ